MKPISGRPGRERQPDGTALDELRKAFGLEDLEQPDDGDPTGPAAADAEPYEFEIIEQAPDESDPSAPRPQPAEPVAPVEPGAPVEPVAVAAPATPPPATPPPATPPPKIIKIGFGGDTSDPEAPAVGLTTPESPVESAAGDRQVIAIDADDLPDPVYVEGSLESGGSASIVIIEDDDEADALTPESDRDLRRGIEPRMRERRVAVKRAQGRKRLRWVFAALGVVLVGVALLATFGSSLFAIEADQVTITGNVYTDPERLQAVVDELVGTPVLVADTQRAERDLEAIPWVLDAKVTTDFPHAATIEIRERQAIATYQGPDGRFRVLDREGRVLDVIDKYPFAYVLITGPDPVDLEAAEVAPRGYQGAAELAKNLTGTVRGRVAQIEVTADGARLVMWLDDGSEVRFGEARDLFTKLVRLETVLTHNPERVPGPIDVSTSQTTLSS